MKMQNNIQVMGIVNITSDSFFPGSRMIGPDGCIDFDKIRATVQQMLRSGVDILDVGACSTRPGSKSIDAESEWERLKVALPVIRNAAPETPISVDTFNSSVVEKVYDLIGPFIVNDISAGTIDGRMLTVVGRLGLPYVAMHMRGTPETMATLTDYPNGVVAEVLQFFQDFAAKADKAGIKDWYLDPGFGFAKTIEQNYELLNHMDVLQQLGRPILVGLSRKSMVYRLLGQKPEDTLASTQALNMVALERGATVLRVHDVQDARNTISIYKKLIEN